MELLIGLTIWGGANFGDFHMGASINYRSFFSSAERYSEKFKWASNRYCLMAMKVQGADTPVHD